MMFERSQGKVVALSSLVRCGYPETGQLMSVALGRRGLTEIEIVVA